MGSLSGKVVVVTGASRGLGKGIALGLGEAGATVYITGRATEARLRFIAGDCREYCVRGDTAWRSGHRGAVWPPSRPLGIGWPGQAKRSSWMTSQSNLE